MITTEEDSFEKHYTQSLAKSKAEGKAEGVRETARAMKQGGLPLSQIAQFTGLSESEIATL